MNSHANFKTFKNNVVSLSKISTSKLFVTYTTLLEFSKHYKMGSFPISFAAVVVFHKLKFLLTNQILLISCIFIKWNVWNLRSLKIVAIKTWSSFNFGTSSFLALKNVLTSLLSFSYVCYQVHLSNIQLNEIAILTACSFNNS